MAVISFVTLAPDLIFTGKAKRLPLNQKGLIQGKLQPYSQILG